MKDKRKIVISVHGIESQGEWQKELAPLISERGWVYYPLHYGIFRTYEFLQPWKRTRQVNWFRDEYNRIMDHVAPNRPSVIAHSFGTYIVTEALDIGHPRLHPDAREATRQREVRCRGSGQGDEPKCPVGLNLRSR